MQIIMPPKKRIIEPYKIGFTYDLFTICGKTRKIKEYTREHNLMPDVAIDYVVDTALNGGAQSSTWYCGIAETSYSPVAGETMTTLMGNVTECEKYSGGARKTLTPDAIASGLYSNAGTPIEFTFTATATIRVAFLSSNSVWTSTAGMLLSAVELSSPKVIDTVGDILRVVTGVQLSAA